MAHAVTRALGVLATIALVVAVFVAATRLLELAERDRWTLAAPHATSVLDLLAMMFVGRVTLSWLPPGVAGTAGSHRLRDLPLTLATSLAVAPTLLAPFLLLADDSPTGLAVAFAVAAVLLLARFATCPAPMVPGHALEHAPPRGVARVASTALALWISAALFVATFVDARAHMPVDPAWTLFVAVLLVTIAHGLREARIEPRARGLTLLLVAAAWGVGVSLWATVALAAASWAIPWIRRNDRRAGALACLYLASACAFGGGHVALAGGAALVVASTATQRRWLLRWVAIGAVVALVVLAKERALDPSESGFHTARFAWAAFVLASIAAVAGLVVAARTATGAANRERLRLALPFLAIGVVAAMPFREAQSPITGAVAFAIACALLVAPRENEGNAEIA